MSTRINASKPRERSVFTLIGGTTIADHAAIVRTHCREGSEVELRRSPAGGASIDVWLACPKLSGLLKTWKKIGEVPPVMGDVLLVPDDVSATVVAHGVVKTVYAPVGREESVVSVELQLPASRLS